jgi:hypothetical protein
MDNGITIIENVLDFDLIKYCQNKTSELASYFKVSDSDQWYHNKLGSHTEFRGKSLRVNYLEEAQIYNPLLWQNFEPAYNVIAKKLSDHLQIECLYDKRFFLPGIRTFIPKKLGVLTLGENNKAGYHYDYNILIPDWKMLLGKDILNTISVTVIIEIPDYSHFYYIKETETNNISIFSKNPTFEEAEAMLPRKEVVICKEGSAICQWNHIIHTMGDMKFSNLNQRRTTMQISGVHDGERIWLSW